MVLKTMQLLLQLRSVKGRIDVMSLNELLFYGGISVVVLTLVSAVVFFVLFYVNKIKLNAKFDKEYGEKSKVGKKR